MCWNLTAATVFTIIGLSAGIYFYKKKEHFFLWLPLIYFSLMEALQAITYLVINRCDLPLNQLLTYIGYLHITFQPIFVSMIALYFIPKDIRKKVIPWVFTVCGISVFFMLIKVYPFTWAGVCKPGLEVLCQTNLCSFKGGWHLAWSLPLNGMGWWMMFIGYNLPVFILPFIYGSWKFNIFHIIFGPTLAFLLTFNLNEYAAVWCLFSILFLVVIFHPKLRKQFHVKKYFLWKLFKKK